MLVRVPLPAIPGDTLIKMGPAALFSIKKWIFYGNPGELTYTQKTEKVRLLR